jgi:hypothetical protein
MMTKWEIIIFSINDARMLGICLREKMKVEEFMPVTPDISIN